MTESRIQDLPGAMSRRDHPTVGVWNRLEGRPRTTDFGRALRVEVRDPLWMLARQWQLGEFRGTDGGSPVTATYSVTASPPGRFRSDSGPDGSGPAGPCRPTGRWRRSRNGGRCRSRSAPSRSRSTCGWRSADAG